jgi:transcriptional regulator with XRE-family HTH domain
MVSKDKKTNEISKALGLAIREIRAEIPISQEELAHRADLDRGYMGSVERGVYNLTIKNIAKVCKALGVKPSQLLKVAEKYWVQD